MLIKSDFFKKNINMHKIRNWLVIGIQENWDTALSQSIPIWGLKLRYKNDFKFLLNIGDIVWFYVTSPIKGVVGIGVVKDKYIDDINLIWNEELIKKEVIWPLRFRIQVLKLISKENWKNSSIKINDFNIVWQRVFQLLKDEHVIELIKRFEKGFWFCIKWRFFYWFYYYTATKIKRKIRSF